MKIIQALWNKKAKMQSRKDCNETYMHILRTQNLKIFSKCPFVLNSSPSLSLLLL